MKKYSILWFAVLLCGLSTSCKDFLNEYSQNLAYIETASDLEELLLGSGYQDPAMTICPGAAIATFGNKTQNRDFMTCIHLMDDDIKEAPAPVAKEYKTRSWQIVAGYYRWADDPAIGLTGIAVQDYIWADFYRRIAVLNSIISAIPEQRSKHKFGEEETLNQVGGETYFLRAWYYFMLTNIYGAPYDKSNPNATWGVPLKLSEEVIDIYYSRNTVGEVYASIEADLKKAIEFFKLLSSPRKNAQHGSIDACYALLSRVYLYMERYEDCIEVANKIEGYGVKSLSSLPVTESFATLESVETIFSHGPHEAYWIFGDDAELEISSRIDIDHLLATGEIVMITTRTVKQNGWSYACSPEFEGLFDENDYRLNRFFSRTRYAKNLVPRKYKSKISISEYDPVSMDTVVYANTGTPASTGGWLRYPEILLNKAEAQACLGQSEAVSTLRSLMQYRYKKMPTIPSGGKELVDFVRLERRKELCYEGHRWFDLRRYAVNNTYPCKRAIEHVCYQIATDAGGSVIAEKVGETTLEEYNDNSFGSWMIPIPQSVIEFCDGNMKNPVRGGVTANFVIEEEEEEIPVRGGASCAVDPVLYSMMKDLRKKLSKRLEVPPFVIFQDPSLEAMATTYPITLEELQNIPGVGAGKAKRYGAEFIALIKRHVEENEIERPEDLRVKTVANKSKLKVSIVQSIDRKVALDDIAVSKGLEFGELLDEVEAIVYSGTRINIDYFLNDVMDEDHIEDIYEYFKDSETDDLEEAIEELGGDYTEEEIRLVRIKFLSEMAN